MLEITLYAVLIWGNFNPAPETIVYQTPNEACVLSPKAVYKIKITYGCDGNLDACSKWVLGGSKVFEVTPMRCLELPKKPEPREFKLVPLMED